MCCVNGTLNTDGGEGVKINTSAVLGTIAVGIGSTQFSELCSALDLPAMAHPTYRKEETKLGERIKEEAIKEMITAGEEEHKLAQEAGDVDENGVPTIAVTADGAWAKRSHKTNYNALSGVACIVGVRTRKVLYVGVRNKFCLVCRKHAKKETPKHICHMNWTKASTAMEADIIVDGFNKSLQMHGMKYIKLIADGDSSVYKRIRDAKPYGPSVFIEKIECRNHILRNYCNNIREVFRRSNGDKDFAVVKDFVLKNILKFRTAIVSAIRYRKRENVSMSQRVSSLKKDILNGPSHIFGNHENCASYFCEKHGQGSSNSTAQFRSSVMEGSIFQSLLKCLNRVVSLAPSLLYDVDNNNAESFNSIVNKHVGGKRINFTQKRGYEVRSYAAAISYNSKGMLIKRMIGTLQPDGKVGTYIEKWAPHSTKWKRNQDKSRKCKQFKKKKNSAPKDSHYGAVEEDSDADDMPLEAYEAAKEVFLDKLASVQMGDIQRATLGQHLNQAWSNERSTRLTASNFGKVCNMRLSTNTANTVKTILYPAMRDWNRLPMSLQYGNEYEPVAISQFEATTGLTVEPCGLFIDNEFPYLGASPDGLIGTNTIIEVKCPFAAKELSIKNAIIEKSIKYLYIDNTDAIQLKPNHNYMFQIQGQLHITNRDKCYFVVYTKQDLFITLIERSDNFWETNMQEILQKFYMKALLPELIDSRYKRDKTIRTILRKDL